jgi:malonate-semialdehyde dehydrogenase (acetylating)/methylmalonate-semialdehyde dehydrogenase
MHQAGLPPGVLNVVHGAHGVVNALCDHKDIRAVSFVGSDQAGRHVYQRASLAGKRVQVGGLEGVQRGSGGDQEGV